ncbi:TIGR02269 family lipoprotein [Melittangium boletus]|uniref:Putative lipoprotein n=1 Tax=Melittangium boletus DSM 14713 TaxID=1294270 RepID=A0A250IQR4_9BACT|nr:TIGR02269 family lipoprotein [Melittangium boletus]ATB34074.1 putative lipoprotein [Melittangium boletus DSM 14713]
MRLRIGWVVLVGLLAACAGTGPLVDMPPEPSEESTSWDEGCEDARNLVLVCREQGSECGLFPCRDVFAPEVLLAFRGGGGGLPLFGGSPAPRRWWGRAPPGWPGSGQPVLTFRFNRHFAPKPPPFILPPGRWARHHLFPQEKDLRDWFHQRGVPDIHQYTILIPEHLHLGVHAGGGRGGLWNQAWRDFRDTHQLASPAEIYQHAGALLYQFQLTGPIVPYHGGGRSR